MRAADGKAATDTALAGKSAAGLIKALDHPNKWQRQTAARLLGEQRPEGGEILLKQWIREHSTRTALDALWALFQAGWLDEKFALETLRHPWPGVRAWTVRLSADRGTLRGGALVKAVAELGVTEPHPEVRSQIASTAGRVPANQALALLHPLLRRAEDQADPYIPLLCWWAIERLCSRDAPSVIALFADEKLWDAPIVFKHILPRLMRRFAAAGRIADFRICADLLELAPADKHRARLLEGFEQAFERGAPPAIPQRLADALSRSGGLSLQLRVRRGDPKAIEKALAMVADEAAKAGERMALIRALGTAAPPAAEAALVKLATNSRAKDDIASAAITALSRYQSRETGLSIARGYGMLPPAARSAAQSLLASRVSWAQALLDEMEAGRLSPGGIDAGTISSLRQHGDPTLMKQVRRHFGDPPDEGEAARAEAQREIKRVRNVLGRTTGSPYRGEPIYLQRCSACHRLLHKGGNVGPDLTNYQREDLSTLVPAIVDPGAGIREGFEMFLIMTKDGRSLNGFLADQDKEAVVLRPPGGGDLTLPRSSIREMKTVGRSLMPDKLLTGLNDQQLADLFAYLRISQPISR